MAHWPSLGAVIDNEKVNAFKGGFILPNLLQEMTDVLGAALTCKLGQSMGGARVYIPKKIQANDPLALLLGGQDAERLCAHYAGNVLDLPSKYFFRAVCNHHITSAKSTTAAHSPAQDQTTWPSNMACREGRC
ncbi:hypothetical protein [Candidatus Williamhamiltonella defendens]|uniref:Uncharacterized protein n=1 Tax=Candidatus Williamhamiltonella defendens TaxID=138072 RepID=A0A2D3TE22_9ENTR|nr:hypothetical protein [Candidatus Hamiltonella defensa]ATW33934.1 hypothetical protein BJP43_06285 [Candidatus Hamiltonella defensa]